MFEGRDRAVVSGARPVQAWFCEEGGTGSAELLDRGLEDLERGDVGLPLIIAINAPVGGRCAVGDFRISCYINFVV